ncbi:hypothetical protein MAPG_03213 [Magnaporthiopsis poae ATCC 64411]|uniref:Uncharacterized protein n=1 Tax=Magnaporthiopsis poae (strain ATCC 64411 / 73-15) TaxID=644358 RepID=A0A0C4DTE7_MAGP6|nr:hypothetical protein MAPG_03213 [Magnaporthiopsis poae ATCC 64411]
MCEKVFFCRMCGHGEITRCHVWEAEERRLHGISWRFLSLFNIERWRQRREEHWFQPPGMHYFTSWTGPADPNHVCQATTPDPNPSSWMQHGSE